MGIARILDFPVFYNWLCFIVNEKKIRSVFANNYIRARNTDRILDIGCGTANILEYLPANIEYVGFDSSSDYIEFAKKKFEGRGVFFCDMVTPNSINRKEYFDIVIVAGVLHHLNDEEASNLFKLAKTVLKPDGRIITLDGCFKDGQSFIERFILSHDRGKYVRREEDYRKLAATQFSKITSVFRNDLNRLPYTYTILECSNT